jgi:2-polyprenyl-3-methyl-5-hydroxy-6-metoxy-1,4-benzoquinol methylase
VAADATARKADIGSAEQVAEQPAGAAVPGQSPPASYKDRIYENYYRTHILPRKGAVTIAQLDKAKKVFDLHFGRFLPADKEAEIIDAGCGAGNLVYWMQKAGYRNARGIDSSVDQIEAGKALGIANLEVADLLKVLKESRDRFELIFMRDVLEHIEKEHVLPMLDMCLAALTPGGRLVMQMPNGASPVVGRVLYGDFTHESAYTVTSLSQLFLLAGYDDLKFYPFEPHFPRLRWNWFLSRAGWRVVARRASWKIVRSLYWFMIYAEIGAHQTITTFNLIAAGRRPATPAAKAAA